MNSICSTKNPPTTLRCLLWRCTVRWRFRRPARFTTRRSNMQSHSRTFGSRGGSILSDKCWITVWDANGKEDEGMTEKALRLLAVLLAALFVFAGAAAAESIKVGFISRDLNYLPFFVGQKKGFYAAEGLQIDLVFIGRPDLQLQAVVAGELHFAN
ncbi:MAG: hypothetical protein E6J89_18335, partial [Deltaproteobacteria bacterium]